jgi:hypothetical protein
MKECATKWARFKPCVEVPYRFLYSTKAVEKRISKDPQWNTKPRAFMLRYVADAIIRHRLGVMRDAHRRSVPARLHSQALKGAIGNDYKAALQWLMDKGLVGTDGEWRKGEKATGYFLTKRGWRGGIVPVELDDRQAARYLQARARLKKESDKKRKAEGVPVDYLRFHLGKLRWPDGAVEEHFESLPVVERWQDVAKVEAHEYSVSLVLGRDYTFTRCRAGRLHYAMTNLPKALRRGVQYDGEELVEIDVSSCQPFLAGLMLYEDALASRPDWPWVQDFIANEKRRYLEDVIGGVFYEQIGEAIGFKGERSDLKQAILAEVFFSSEEQAAQSEIVEVFANVYGVLWGEILKSKMRLRVWSGDSDLALRLQGAEARIVIDGALARIAREMPDVPAFPIHDCLMTLERHAVEVERIMAEEFVAAMGIAPSFSVKKTTKNAGRF